MSKMREFKFIDDDTNAWQAGDTPYTKHWLVNNLKDGFYTDTDFGVPPALDEED